MAKIKNRTGRARSDSITLITRRNPDHPRRAAQRNGQPTRRGIDGRHNPHAFRHAWGREALRQGADISDVSHVLGHAQIQTTYEFYGRWHNAELHAIHDRYTLIAPDQVLA